MDQIELTLDLVGHFDQAEVEDSPQNRPEFDGVIIRIGDSEIGHGFGLSTLINVTIELMPGVASSVVAAALYDAVGSAIRRVRSGAHVANGSEEAIAELVDLLRQQAKKRRDASD